MRRTRNTLLTLATTAVLAGGVGAGSAAAHPTNGTLCTWTNDLQFFGLYDRPEGTLFHYVASGVKVRIHYWNENARWGWGHAADSYPTDGWAPRRALACS